MTLTCCRHCAAPLATRTRCERCRQEHNETMRIKRKTGEYRTWTDARRSQRRHWLATGRCGDCGEPSTARRCEPCARRFAALPGDTLEIQRRRRLKRAAAGLCTRCGQAAAATESRMCARCRERRAAYRAGRREAA